VRIAAIDVDASDADVIRTSAGANGWGEFVIWIWCFISVLRSIFGSLLVFISNYEMGGEKPTTGQS
jgi:hypothetical protein